MNAETLLTKGEKIIVNKLLKCAYVAVVCAMSSLVFVCGCSRNSQNTGGGILGKASQVSDEVKNSGIFDGYVQIGDLVVKPYSGMLLSEFEKEGFEITDPEVDYSTRVGDHVGITLTKGNVEIYTDVITDESTPQVYRDCPITYIASVRLIPAEKEISVWIHDGIKLGESIDQITSLYPNAEYDSSEGAYTVHPLSFGWEYTAVDVLFQTVRMWDYDINVRYAIDDDFNIRGYNFYNFDLLAESVNAIPYEESVMDYGTYGEPYKMTMQIPTIRNDEPSINNLEIVPICTNGSSTAKVFFSGVDHIKSVTGDWVVLNEIDISDKKPIYQTDTYSVYWNDGAEQNSSTSEGKYILFNNDPDNYNYGICFSLMIVDSDGNIITSQPYMSHTKLADYVVMDGQKMLDIYEIQESGDTQTPYAYQLAVDIFDHMSRYKVTKELPKA